jgi:hypothetical protein
MVEPDLVFLAVKATTITLCLCPRKQKNSRLPLLRFTRGGGLTSFDQHPAFQAFGPSFLGLRGGKGELPEGLAG